MWLIRFYFIWLEYLKSKFKKKKIVSFFEIHFWCFIFRSANIIEKISNCRSTFYHRKMWKYFNCFLSDSAVKFINFLNQFHMIRFLKMLKYLNLILLVSATAEIKILQTRLLIFDNIFKMNLILSNSTSKILKNIQFKFIWLFFWN